MTLNKRLDITEEDTTRLLELFQQFHPLNVWSKVKKSDFTMKRFELGYVNDIICCEMTEEARQRLCKNKDDCSAIVVKFSFDENLIKIDKLEEVVNNTIISAAGFGPRLLFANNECMVHEFVQSRLYSYEDDFDQEIVKQLAQILARFHAMRPPISRKGMDSWNDGYNRIFNNSSLFKPVFEGKHLEVLEQGPSELKDKYYSFIEDFHIEELLDQTHKILDQIELPIVFAHMDMIRSNRLIKESLDENGNKVKKIYLLDFDFSSYGYRAHDFCAIFSSFKNKEYIFGSEGFATDESIKFFLEEYRNESERLQPGYLDDPLNSLEAMLKECKLYSLKYYVFVCAFALSLIVSDKDNLEKLKYNLEGFLVRFTQFKALKQRFFSEGLFSN